MLRERNSGRFAALLLADRFGPRLHMRILALSRELQIQRTLHRPSLSHQAADKALVCLAYHQTSNINPRLNDQRRNTCAVVLHR